MNRVSFTVVGQPVGKQRARTFVHRGRVVSKTPAETVRYEKQVWLAARAVVGFRHQPWTGPVRVTVRCFMGDARRRDLDNVIKSVTDALNKKIFHDDCQIADLYAVKRIDRARPRVEVELELLSDQVVDPVLPVAELAP